MLKKIGHERRIHRNDQGLHPPLVLMRILCSIIHLLLYHHLLHHHLVIKTVNESGRVIGTGTGIEIEIGVSEKETVIGKETEIENEV